MADYIRLVGMQFYAHRGADPGERELGQRFEVDLEIESDSSAAGRSDELASAINYRDAYELVRECMTPPCQLLEAVAERIAERVLARFEIDAVTVWVRKPSVPIGGVIGYAEVEIHRE